jgi:hypothetical protein
MVLSNLLRVIRKGLAVKNTVDEAIDRCSVVFNLIDSIEGVRMHAEQATAEANACFQGCALSALLSAFDINSSPGLRNLRRYFTLIVFQAYLQSTEPDTMRSFETFETFVAIHTKYTK